ncbi:MAG: hypothetical protein IKQ15_12180 [Kiritimatiellae bacterium]|nr:hypothetical protein [Kiritimatiellia bacterium]
MNNLSGKKTAAYRRTLSRLRAVLGSGMILEGSVCRVSAGAAHWHLTRKANGRTSTLYVPDAEVGAVKEAAARWKEVRALVKELGEEARRLLEERLASRSSGGGGGGRGRRRAGSPPSAR